MDYLNTLKEIKDAIGKNKELKVSHKVIVIDLISKEEKTYSVGEDSFVYFYEDVIQNKITFDFETALTSPVYLLAQGDATNCIHTSQSIKNLEDNSSLYTWLQNAIKFTDHLALHYLQNIINEIPVPQNNAGRERSRYIQINVNKNNAQKAGRILDNLYACRNKMEHRRVSNNEEDKQTIIPPNYKQIRRQIQKRYPEALICFQDSFADHYK